MKDIPKEEALALLNRRLICEEPDPWVPVKLQPGTTQLRAGLIDQDGASTQLQVELMFRRGHKTGLLTYKFTVFRTQLYGHDRVYQLHVVQSKMKIKDAHALPHEHIGASREPGDASWATWGYDDILKHFCHRTNIEFAPNPNHPEDFKLKGNR
ncbi:hypothetical protein [Massilia brevitalea]|uniref:hypothetical protein n=1 Tax=Massilia brevitalea TaxID=442526 RepID=UPI002738DEF1|nr:hypothetical protein [Massilia brevitalea]